MRVFLVQAAAVALLLAHPPALAQSPDASERAERLNEKGKAHYQEGELERAAHAFRRASALSPEPRYAFNLCFVLRDQEKLRNAMVACERVLESDVSERLEKKTRRLIESIERRLAAGERPADPSPQAGQGPPQPAGGSSSAAPAPEPAAAAADSHDPIERPAPQRPPYPAEDFAPYEDRPWSVTGHLGLATPYGFVGAELERTFSSPFAVAAGVGRGLESAQISATGRLRNTGHNPMTGVAYAVGLGLGVSGGDAHLLIPADRTFRDSIWINADVYGELRFPAGVVLRLYTGWGQIVAYSECTEADPFDGPEDCGEDQSGGAPYLGLAVGVTF